MALLLVRQDRVERIRGGKMIPLLLLGTKSQIELCHNPEVQPLLDLLAAAKVYDLAQPYFTGMPHHPVHPPFLFSLVKQHGEYVGPTGNSSASDALAMGTHVGRMSANAKGAFTIVTATGKVTDIGKKYCRRLQKADGYGYTQKGEAAFPPVP